MDLYSICLSDMLVTLAGYVALVVVVGRLLAYLSKYVKSPVKVRSLGDWALVTGATDGIGKFLSFSSCQELFTQ